MYARITPFRMKPDRKDEAAAMVDGLREQVMGMPGMLHFTCAMDADGAGYIVALVESKAASDANMPRVKEIWGNFAGHLAEPPVAQGYEVIADWNA